MPAATVELVADSGPGGDCLVCLHGEFDRSTSSQLVELSAWYSRSSRSAQLTLDLADVTFLGASAIDALLHTQQQLATAGRTLVLDNVPDPVARILRLANIATRLGI